MPRPARDQQACDELAAHLNVRYSRLPYPKPSWPEMAKAIARDFDISVTDETLKKMHHAQVDPHTTSPEFLIGVALYYGIDRMADLGPTAAARLGRVLELAQNWKKLSRSPIAA